MNEVWILSPDENLPEGQVPIEPPANSINDFKKYTENYSKCSVKGEWSGGIADNGRFLMHGTETWYYENGNKQYQASYEKGEKTGIETYWNEDGNKEWTIEYK